MSTSPQRGDDVERRWHEAFGPLVAQQLKPDQRYSIVRVGDVEYAFSDYDAYVRALRQVWDAGFVPEPRPSATGAELPDAAPELRGVDVDLADLRRTDVRSRPRRTFRR